MNLACIRHTELPGTSALFSDLLYRYDQVRDLYPHPPQLDQVASAKKQLAFPPERRAALVEALRSQNIDAGEATAAHLDLLAEPDTIVVATGQQVGLFGGPVFALYKALTAAKYADLLRRRGTPAVAVFWLATEDHDLAEVDHAWSFDARFEPHRLTASATAAPAQPVGQARWSSEPVGALSDLLIGMEFADETIAALAEAFDSGASLGASFRKYFERLLEPYGLIQLDPMDPAIRSLAAPVIHRVIDAGADLIDELLERGTELERRDYHQQVKVDAETSLLFRITDAGRYPLRRKGEVLRGDGTSYDTAQLHALIDEQPASFSPNALLRPVVQDYLLPTAAFIGGPAELAYLAQSRVIYDRILGRMPVVMPRSGFTLVDRRAGKLLERFDLRLQDCFLPEQLLRQKIAEQLTPSGLTERFAAEREAVSEALGRLEGSLNEFDPTLGEALRRSGRKIHYQLNKVEAKASRESLRRDDRGELDAALLTHLLYPQRTLQERLYCAAPFLARHGPKLPAMIYDAIEPDCPDHRILAF